MQSCGVRNEEKIKEEFFESLILFKLEPCRIEAKRLDDMESKETARKLEHTVCNAGNFTLQRKGEMERV